MAPKKGKRSQPCVVVVEWDDTVGASKWISLHELLDQQPDRCLSIGWLLSKTPKQLILAAARNSCEGEDARWADTTIIPAGCVISMRVLSKVVVFEKKAKEARR